MRLVELRDINRGVVFVNPDHVQMIQAEGQGTFLRTSNDIVLVKESILAVKNILESDPWRD